jgi:subtilisin family serine protease
MRLRFPRAVRLGALFAVAAAFVAVPAGGQVGTGLSAAGADVAPSALASGPVMLELAGPPAAVVHANELSSGASASAAAAASRAQKQRNSAAQAAVVSAVGSDLLYSVQTAYNGVAVSADSPAEVARYAELPGVTAVHPIPLAEPHNASSVGFIGAHQAWQAFGATGEGMTIAVLDTGIDYTHTGFGGSGSPADLATAKLPANNVENPNPTTPFSIPGIYPTAKVVGGHDLVGDAYNASGNAAAQVPHPDRNPMDCNGHGSHVSGTAAGNGVNADGTTYTGPYDASVPAETMRIGPGVAPEAEIMFYRVFGCAGSTAVTALAIDMAVDPNRDGNPSDHVDVINMSLGSAFGTADDPSAAASQNAASNGVVVVASAGNDSDVYYITGSPASSTRTISVASSTDPVDVTDAFRVDSPASIAGLHGASRAQSYNWLSPPPPPTPPAPGVATPVPVTADLFVPSTANRFGCNPYTGADATGALGKVILVDWKVGNDPFPCGSAVRANNATNAGAKGVIMADSVPYLDTAIAGNAFTPAMYTTSTVGDALKAALAGGTVSITLSAEWINSTKIVTPGRGDMLSGFSSRGPRSRGAALKPDIAAPGQGIFSVDNDTGTLGFSNQGTSMAAPHIAGVMALLKAAHPTWSVEELKALAMNTAGHDVFTGLGQTGARYGVARVGAGRVDVPAALGNQVVAYDSAGAGAVSVSFGALEVDGTDIVERLVRVVNHGTSARTFTKSVDLKTDMPGVSITFPGAPTVSVAARGSATFRVRLTANSALMKNTHDPTISENAIIAGLGTLPRHWLSEESGLILLTPRGGGTTLRVPVYATARPVSKMGVADESLDFGTSTTSQIELEGKKVSTGVEPLGWVSKVSAFELQATSPQATLPAGVSELARNADLRYVGAAMNQAESSVYFGVSTWGEWATPATDVQFSVQLDLDRNGTVDRTVFNTRFTGFDVFVTALVVGNSALSLDFTNIFPANVTTAPFDTDVVVLPVPVGGTGNTAALPNGTTRFNYRIQGLSRFWGLIDQTGWLTYDLTSPGLAFTGGLSGTPMFLDRGGQDITVSLDAAAYGTNMSQGALLLHHMNAQGARAQVVGVTP